jgi:hypothetical protein
MRLPAGVLAAALLFGAPPSTAVAAGFGLGLSYHNDTVALTKVNDNPVDRPSYGSSSIGVNLVFDNAVAKHKLVNYRLSLGLETQEFESRDKVEVRRIMVGNTLGVAVKQTNGVRVWLGARLASGWGIDGGGEVDSNWNIGIAPVIGVNFHLGSTASLGLELGYDYGEYHEHEHAGWLGGPNRSGTMQGAFLNGVILFRTSKDRWQAIGKPAASQAQTPGIAVPQ